MATNFEEKQQKSNINIRSIYDYTMGVLWTAVGVFFLFQKQFGYDLGIQKGLATVFGVAALLYGLFRVYRGYKARSKK
jgi:hypothetical protein